MDDILRLLHILALPFRILAAPVTALVHRHHKLPSEVSAADLPPLGSPWDQDDRWFRGGFPPHPGTQLIPLIHGDEYLPDLVESIRGARQRVTVAGWCLTPHMPLLRTESDVVPDTSVADILRDATEPAEVYVLLWAGAPAVFRPDRKTAKTAMRNLLAIAPKVHCALDYSAPFGHDQHQKAVTVDGRVAWVGGMDLTTFAGDRWDSAHHPLRFGPNWHDIQMRIEGEAVRDVEENFRQRWNAVTGEHLELLPSATSPDRAGVTAQIVRTIPRGFYPFAPDGEYGIAHAYLSAIPRARRFIYLENQYLWSPEIVDALIEAMNRPRGERFRIVMVLPARAYTGKYDNDRNVRRLQDADAGRGIFACYSPYAADPAFGSTGYRYLPIYVHAKVGIIDDEWLTVGSANLNQRGLANDAEMNVQAVTPDLARSLRSRLWGEHLGMTDEAVAAADPLDLIDTVWPDVARKRRASLRAQGPPEPRAGHIVDYRPGSNPGSRALDILEAVTLEH